MSEVHSAFARLTVLAALAVTAACTHPARSPAVPHELTTQATVPGMPGVRYWFDADPQPMIRDALASFERERAYLVRSGHRGDLPPASFLAVSGGGDNGAFGAGLLVGWTEAGTRPEFKVVTGISTGALTAPFAFLGPDYDDQLKAVYTTISAKDVAEERSFLAALYDDAMADNRPLWNTVSRYATEDMLKAIAYEYEEKGRLLLISTTDLDARRAVIWNMGAIAASGHPEALTLFRRILVASAAIPGIFPPTMIDVEVDGKTFQEMHVDGGAMAQVFLYPPGLHPAAETRKRGLKPRERHLYIIRNARVDPDWAAVERQTLDIVGRAISSLIQTQGTGDLYQIYLIAERDGVDYNLAYIGRDFVAAHTEEFDPVFMNALFDYGYQLARNGYPWRKLPPGFEDDTVASGR